MVLVAKTRLEVDSAATFFLLSHVSFENGIMGPSVRQWDFRNHAYGACAACSSSPASSILMNVRVVSSDPRSPKKCLKLRACASAVRIDSGYATRARVRVADDMATPGGGGGRLRILSARVSAALGSGALALALAGGLAGLLATGTAVSRPKAATPWEPDLGGCGTFRTDTVTFGPVEAGWAGWSRPLKDGCQV